MACHTHQRDIPRDVAGGIVQLPPEMSIADSGAIQVFVMDGTPVNNRRPTTRPLKVALADGRIVTSTHMCDIVIEGLPTILTGTLPPEGYIRNVPLSRVPVRHSAIPDYYEDQYGVPTYITPRSLVESAAYAFSPTWQAIAINT